MSVFAIRLKTARLEARLSQEQLGIHAGLDEMSANTRMNRYELGKRTPNIVVVEKIAEVLNVPIAYFFARTDEEAKLLVHFHRFNKKKKQEVLSFIESL